eukprot:TRINITY_DN2229_c0_g1_i1.p1 TRINITY_DN2229_c0_g1~~TRINITY_DN2229_c0_g1_i1.p1  ORF type:complete len:260 (+),score=29.41 TRINITY_DN2229_c0_g1_i1:51-782(+)
MSIAQLPDEIVEVIFANLRDQDLLRATAVCKSWGTISESSWKTRALEQASSIVADSSWKRCYYDSVVIRFGDCDSKHSVIISDGLGVVKFDASAWSIARLKRPISGDTFYFEVLIEMSIRNQVMIGIVGEMEDSSWTSHVGYCKNGFGYYGRNGFCESHKRQCEQLEPFQTGDRVGCFVDFISEHLVYYVNGRAMLPAFSGLISREKIPGPIYGAVSLSNASDKLQIVRGARRPTATTTASST